MVLLFILVGHLLNKIHVVFDAFDSLCYSYVHKKVKKQQLKKKKRIRKRERKLKKKNIKNKIKSFGLGALNL